MHIKRHYSDFNAECYLCKHREMTTTGLQKHMRIHVSYCWLFVAIDEHSNSHLWYFILNRPAKNRTRAVNVINVFRAEIIENRITNFTLGQPKSHTSVRCAVKHSPDPDYYQSIISKLMECRCNRLRLQNLSKSIDKPARNNWGLLKRNHC